jgi:hypothetical protein
VAAGEFCDGDKEVGGTVEACVGGLAGYAFMMLANVAGTAGGVNVGCGMLATYGEGCCVEDAEETDESLCERDCALAPVLVLEDVRLCVSYDCCARAVPDGGCGEWEVRRELARVVRLSDVEESLGGGGWYSCIVSVSDAAGGGSTIWVRFECCCE